MLWVSPGRQQLFFTAIKYLGVALVIRSMSTLLTDDFKKIITRFFVNFFFYEYPTLPKFGPMNNLFDKRSHYQSLTPKIGSYE
jgi:hypothetical protein